MNNINMILIDFNDYFLACNNKYNIKIDYKLYSMMAGSIDYTKANDIFSENSFQEIIKHIVSLSLEIKKLEYSNAPTKLINKHYSCFYKEISSLYEPICSLIDTGHLDKQQLSLVMELFIHEFTMHFKSKYFDKNNAMTYTPSILINRDLKNYINSSLLNDGMNSFSLSNVKEELEHTQLVMTFTTFDGISRPVYNIRNTLDFLLVDLHKCLSSKKKIKKCLCCERLFFSSNGAKYCRLPHKDNSRTCDYIMHHRPKDELEDIYNKAKREQAKKRDYESNKKIYGYDFMDNIYDKWLEECKKQYAKARRNDNVEEFKNWVEKTKFIQKRLKFLYKEYEKDNSKNG